jgi:hypothetical protein
VTHRLCACGGCGVKGSAANAETTQLPPECAKGMMNWPWATYNYDGERFFNKEMSNSKGCITYIIYLKLF